MKRWLLLLAACGGGTHHTTDAGPVDALSDSLPTSSDAAANSVSVRITSQGQPMPNVATAFLASDGTKVAELATDASGTAAALLDAGGSVTVILHTGASVDDLRTFTGVKPGDQLQLELAPAGPPTGAQITMTAPTDPSAYDYSLFSSCGDRTGSINGSFAFVPAGCGATADFVVSENNNLDQPMQFIVARGVSLVGSPAITGTYAAPNNVALGYSGMPSVLTSVAAHAVLIGAGPIFAADNSVAVSGGSLSVPVTMPDTTGLGMSMLVSSQLDPISTEAGQQGIHEIAPADQPYNVDLSTAMLPRYVAAPTYAVATRSIAWGEAASATETATLVRARIHVYRNDVPSGRTWSWEIVAPKNGTNVTFPTLPDVDGFSFVPNATDTVTIDELTTVGIAGGYDGNRAHAFDDPVAHLTAGRVAIEVLYTPPL
jgi:hypothetical protein